MVHHFDHRFGTYEGQTDSQANQSKLPELDEAQHADPERVSPGCADSGEFYPKTGLRWPNFPVFS
jgi:hypothetical protein